MKPRFTIQEKMENLCPADEENYCYISMIFDVNRGGVADIAEKILLFLDYESLKQFKKTCNLFMTLSLIPKSSKYYLRECQGHYLDALK